MAAEPLERRCYLSATTSGPYAFDAAVHYAAGTDPVSVVTADFNGDGHVDVAVADGSADQVQVLFGDGKGSLTAGPVLSVGSPAAAIVTADFNGDGLPDLAVVSSPVSNGGDTTVTVFLNDGDGTFAAGRTTAVLHDAKAGEPVAIAAADFNGDGRADVAVTDYVGNVVDVLLSDGAGGFAGNATSIPVHDGPEAIAAGDINGDGHVDLVVGGTYQVTDVTPAETMSDVLDLLGEGNGLFNQGPDKAIGEGVPDPTSIGLADLDGDGVPDLAFNDVQVTWLGGGVEEGINDGTGTFDGHGLAAPGGSSAIAGGAAALAFGDFDLDGHTDLAVADAGDANVTIASGPKSGTENQTFAFPVDGQPAVVAVADLNGDGEPDVIAASPSTGTVSVLLNATALALIPTVTTLVANQVDGKTVSLTATVKPIAVGSTSGVSSLPGESVPTGTVSFYFEPDLLGTATLGPDGTATLQLTAEQSAEYPLEFNAAYSGDAAYAAGSLSAPATSSTPPTPTGVVRGTVFVDTNGDGVQDNGEAGLANVFMAMNTFTPGDSDVYVTTDASGRFMFQNVRVGTYYLSQSLPSGYQEQLPTTGNYVVNVTANATVGGEDFALTRATTPTSGTGSVSGTVYEDTNGDGKREVGEPGLADVSVFADLNGDGSAQGDEPMVSTGSDGSYTITGLPAGTYAVRPWLSLNGHALSQPGSGAYRVTIKDGQTIAGRDFGEAPTSVAVPAAVTNGTISGTVFTDANGDGWFNDGEPGVAGVTVSLRSSEGTDTTATSDANGRFTFTGLAGDTYALTDTVPTGETQTVPLDGAYSVTLTAEQPDVAGQNFGLASSAIGTVAAGAVPVVARSTVPATAVAGAAVRGSVWVTLPTPTPTATPALARAKATTAKPKASVVRVYATENGTIDAGSVLVGTVTRRVRSGVTTLAVPVRSRNLKAGDYQLLAQVTDPTGTVTSATAGPALAVAAATVKLSATVRTLATAELVPGQITTATVVISNGGTVASTGALGLSLGLTVDGTTLAVPLDSVIRHVAVRPGGRSVTVRLRFRVPATATAGSSYRTMVILSYGGTAVPSVGAVAVAVA